MVALNAYHDFQVLPRERPAPTQTDPRQDRLTAERNGVNDYGGVDRNIITGAEIFPHVTQSESFIAANDTTILVAYNDTRGITQNPINLGGVSRSTDGGTTWTRVTGANGQSPFSNTLGDPVLLWNAQRSMWYSAWLSQACSAPGIGVYSSPDGMNWTFANCAVSAFPTDRHSGWVDNNPASSTYGRMWISSNSGSSTHFFVVYTDDGGANWTSPHLLTADRQISNVQMTGSPDITGSNGGPTIFVQAHNISTPGLSFRANLIYRSTDGGQTWTETRQTNNFPASGMGQCSSNPNSLASVFPGYWRDHGWGQPGVGPGGVVHYAYTAHGPGSDPGNIYYIRSTDNGSTWAPPVQLNTDTTTRAQWMPSLAVNTQGTVFVGWYDLRHSTDDGYDRYGRASMDNGATWAPDMFVSDINSPLHTQVDPFGSECYAGDYDYALARGNDFYHTWTDGRNAINGVYQQDVYFDKITLVQGTPTATATGTPPTPTPTRTPRPSRTVTLTPTPILCNLQYIVRSETGATIVPGTLDIGNHCGVEPCVTEIELPFSYRLYDRVFESARVSTNGTLQFESFSGSGNSFCLPENDFSYTIFPFWDFLCTADCSGYSCTDCGIFTSVSGSAPNRILNIEWRTIVQIFGGLRAHFEVRLYEGQQVFDVIYGETNGGANAVVGVQQDIALNNWYTEYSCNTSNLVEGLKVTFMVPPCGTSTPAATTHTPTATPSPPVPSMTVVAASSTPSTPPVSTATPTSCPIQFTDVPASDTFYTNIRCLACRGIVSGYSDGTFRPNNQVTRGQLAKMVSNSAGFSETITGQTFTDVTPTNTFYVWIERLTRRGHMTGYVCGGLGEPCINNMPYFRPFANATRGQTSKIVSNAAGFTEPPVGQTFQDVPPSHTFYAEIQRLASRNVMQGYTCGGAFEPCVGPENKPYFRPGNDVTRGQSSKIVANAFFPECNTP